MLTKNVNFYLTFFIISLFNFMDCNCIPPASTCYNDCTKKFYLKITNLSDKKYSFFIREDDYDDEYSEVDQLISNDTFDLVPGGSIIDTITYTWTGVDGCAIYKGQSDTPTSGSGHATKISYNSGALLRFQKYVYPYDTLQNMTVDCSASLFTCGEKNCTTEYSGELIIN